MKYSHRKEIPVPTLRSSALWIRSGEELMLETTALESFYAEQITLSTLLIN